MNSTERRAKILEIIDESRGPVTGGLLAKRFGVTRQVIVQDLAILRAAGEAIVATPQGYCRPEALSGPGRIRRTYVLRHSADAAEIEAELTAITDLGGRAIDVTVEHPVYGDLTGSLMIGSRREVQDFLHRLATSKAGPLLVLCEGVHLHTIEAPDEATHAAIKQTLQRLGFLLEI